MVSQQPQWSADGQWWWDGQKWIPRAEVQGPIAASVEPAQAAPVVPAQPAPVSPAGPAQPQAPRKGGHGLRNTLIAIGGVLVILIGIGIANGGKTTNQSPTANKTALASSQPAASSAPAQPPVDHTVLTLSGTGYETTQPFKIPSSEWTLNWTISGDPQYAEANFIVYSSNGNRVDEVGGKPGSDSATIHQGKDVFFIEVLVANATYKLTITSKYAGPDQTITLPAMTTLTTVSGSGDKSSSTFHVTGSVWRIHVHAATVDQYTAVTAYVIPAGSTSNVSEASVEGAQGGQDTMSYVYVGPGDYYIKVLSANTAWTVTVEQTSS
jgi:hypothetical protein